jgi:hypothetical protein
MMGTRTSEAQPHERVAVDNCMFKKSRRSPSTGLSRRTGVAAVALAAFFAAGFSSIATSPVARADVEDSLGDVIFTNLDAALGGQAATNLNAVIEYLSLSLHGEIEAAITNPADAQLLDAINFPSVALFGRDLIGNGINVGDPIPALNFLDQSSGPLADTFTGTNEGLLTPELSALHIDVGNLHDGGFLLGDNASGGSGASTPADTLPPISCAGVIGDPTQEIPFVTSSALVTCTGPALIVIESSLYLNGQADPYFSIPGFGVGFTSATATTGALCVPGSYEVQGFGDVVFPPGYTPLTPNLQFFGAGPVDFTCT